MAITLVSASQSIKSHQSQVHLTSFLAQTASQGWVVLEMTLSQDALNRLCESSRADFWTDAQQISMCVFWFSKTSTTTRWCKKYNIFMNTSLGSGWVPHQNLKKCKKINMFQYDLIQHKYRQPYLRKTCRRLYKI